LGRLSQPLSLIRYRSNMNKLKIILIIFSFIIVSSVYAETPDRSKGISVHALPKRVAKISGKPWGLEVAYAPHLKPEPGQPFLQSITDVLRENRDSAYFY